MLIDLSMRHDEDADPDIPMLKKAKSRVREGAIAIGAIMLLATKPEEAAMLRERALKTVLVVVGLLFTAGVVPLAMFFSREPAVPMIMSIYVTLGIFLLLAVRDPAANRSLIAFGGWANLAHAGVMAAQEYRNVIERRELVGVVVFAIVGVVLVALAPAKQPVEKTSAVVA